MPRRLAARKTPRGLSSSTATSTPHITAGPGNSVGNTAATTTANPAALLGDRSWLPSRPRGSIPGRGAGGPLVRRHPTGVPAAWPNGYGGGANKCLQNAERIELISRVPLSCACGFAELPLVKLRVAELGGLVVEETFTANGVELQLALGEAPYRHLANPVGRPEPRTNPAATLNLIRLLTEPRCHRKPSCLSQKPH